MPNRKQVIADRERLNVMVWALKEIEGELVEMSERYDVPDLVKWFKFDWMKLADVDHDITKLITRLKEEL